MDIKRMEKKLRDRVKEMGGRQVRKELGDKNSLTEDCLGQLKKLDYKLKKTLQTHNEIMAENNTLTNEIDVMRREKSLFEMILQNIGKEQIETTKKLETLIDDANQKRESELFEKKKNNTVRKELFDEKEMISKKSRKYFEILDFENKELKGSPKSTIKDSAHMNLIRMKVLSQKI